MAMQVPVVMSTSLGQIPTVAVQQPPGTTGTAGHAALLANASIAAGNAGAQQKVRKAVTSVIWRRFPGRKRLVIEEYISVISFNDAHSVPNALKELSN